MDEGDLEAEQAATRLGVDQLGALPLEIGERRAHVRDLVGHVVHSRPPLREEAPDRRVLSRRCEELDAVGADEERRRLDTLLLDALAVLEDRAEQLRVRGYGLVEVCHGEPHVMDPPGAHAAIVLGRFPGGTSTSSTSPYSTASVGVMNRSRSMSSRTCSVARPEWRAMISAI